MVLLDLVLPDIDGLFVLEKILADKETKDIPVIVISQKTEAEDVQLALEKGAMEYIKKPINETELLARIKSVLRLKAKEDELKRLITLKDSVIKIISHDIRNHLVAIQTFSNVIMRIKDLPEKAVTHVKNIENATNIALDYSTQLLNKAYLESGKLKLNIQKFPLNKLVSEIYNLFRPSAEEKNINLMIDIPENIYVEVDKVLFIQVLSNLIGNAIKFTNPDGKISILGKLNNSIINLSVRDTGIGIDGNKIDKIFTEFSSFRSTGTTGEIGTGLGLSIIKKILDAHNFDIKVHSQKGEGTEFIIAIPYQSQ